MSRRPRDGGKQGSRRSQRRGGGRTDAGSRSAQSGPSDRPRRKSSDRSRKASQGRGSVDAARLLAFLRARRRRAVRPDEIARVFGVGRDGAKRLRALLSELVAEGDVERVPAGFRATRPDGLVEGVFEPAARGRGRDVGTLREDGGREWRVLASRTAPAASSGDRVLLLPRSRPIQGRAPRGEILQILDGSRDAWVGIYSRRRGGGVVTPYRDDADWTLLVDGDESGAARDGDGVVAAPIARPTRRRGDRGGVSALPRVRVTSVLGVPGDAEADTRAVAWRHRWPVDFPREVLAEAEAIDEQISAAEVDRRVDLRDLDFVTIDPASARDFDDAICVESGGSTTRLWVAIADVSHYVTPGGAIDREALSRGNSLYFPDRSFPMLPERLSGDVCSLRPECERLAMVAELTFDARMRVSRRSLYPAVIRSRARLVYQEAASLMGGGGVATTLRGGAAIPSDTALARRVRALGVLAGRLAKRRRAAGAIDFEFPEPKVVLDAAGRVVDVVRAQRTRAHRGVEEAMLAANRAVAEVLDAADRPAVYRIHEPPDERSVGELCELLASFGLLEAKPASDFTAGVLAAALERAIGRPEERLVHLAALRSMRQARYAVANRGHFALAFSHYTHFTSPIRRYADLLVHRALKAQLDRPSGSGGRRGDGPSSDTARQVAGRVSWRERLAIEAERERVEMARCACMAERSGEGFDATVSGVARHGLYVTLDEPFVEGLVHLSKLPSGLVFDEARRTLAARRSGRRFGLGDRLRVRLVEVDRIAARLSFDLEADPSDGRKRRRARAAGGP